MGLVAQSGRRRNTFLVEGDGRLEVGTCEMCNKILFWPPWPDKLGEFVVCKGCLEKKLEKEPACKAHDNAD